MKLKSVYEKINAWTQRNVNKLVISIGNEGFPEYIVLVKEKVVGYLRNFDKNVKNIQALAESYNKSMKARISQIVDGIDSDNLGKLKNREAKDISQVMRELAGSTELNDSKLKKSFN